MSGDVDATPQTGFAALVLGIGGGALSSAFYLSFLGALRALLTSVHGANDLTNKNRGGIEHFFLGLRMQGQLLRKFLNLRRTLGAGRGVKLLDGRADRLVLFEHPWKLRP